MRAFEELTASWGERARLAWDTLALKPVRGIPSFFLNVMDQSLMEQATGRAPGAYAREPERVYTEFQEFAGTCFLDQYIPENPLTMGRDGFSPSSPRGATTGAEHVVVDGIEIASPEDVVEHMECFVFPRRAAEIQSWQPGDPGQVEQMIAQELEVQRRLGTNILKGPYGGAFQSFPVFHYSTYGYADYFTAYALYPEVMERDFAQQADLSALRNRTAARAIVQGGLPCQVRLDHDMADSRGTLVSLRSLDRLWLPQFAHAIKPFLDAGVRLIWHCDGNLMAMVPRLIEAGVAGFQGFQDEDGMDYGCICRMADRNGDPLLIIAGVSVTRTLPFGTRQDVARELKGLVENGPPQGLFLGVTSSVVPGTKPDNVLALIEGLRYYRERGRG